MIFRFVGTIVMFVFGWSLARNNAEGMVIGLLTIWAALWFALAPINPARDGANRHGEADAGQ